ncbi:hypothetical protein CEE44_03755 [Candidatus Woesearchaeota archaeon B3_Woes]|nr:MAG: hypothetical protein CEE44_03755 [Candidatus Woesearchaeota archaeon B3_Woes]
MKEKTLLKIALIVSLIGILILLFISSKLEVNEKTISNIDETDIGSSLKIDGVITNIRKTNTITLIDIAQLEEMKVVVFNKEIELNKGDYVEITGKIEEYKGSTELIADKIILK